MGKNLNTIERSERIRIGKNVPDEQAINTVIINASNVSLNAPLSGLYVAPIRYDTSVLSNTLVYNTVTKEIVDAGISADNQTLQGVSDYGNTTTNTLEFNNPTTGFVSISNVGIANISPIHTLDVGSNLYVNDTGSNVLTVLGSAYIEQNLVVDGNLTVRGDSTLVHSENLTISDPIIELGTNNTSTDFVFDLGIIMNRPGSNVTVGYIEDAEKLVLAYTDSSSSGRYIVPDSSNALSVQVYGNVTANAYFGLGTTLDGVALATDLESNVVRIGVLETDLTSNTGRIEVLETDLASNTVRIEVLETDLASNTGRIEVLETDTASNTARIVVLETDLASNTGRIEVLETDLASNTGRIEVLETDTASNTVRIEVLETDTASNTARIVVLETDLTSNTGRIEVLETDTASNTVRIVVLETDLASNASRIGTLEGQIVTKAPINNPIFTGIITGNGGLISNVTLEQVVSYGNTTSNTLYLTNEDTSLVTEGSMGVGTTTPDKKLHVAGDVLVDANVYAVRYFGDGGLLSNTALTPTLQIVTQSGSTTDRTVEFTNVTTGFITTSNAVFGGNITVQSDISVSKNIYVTEELTISNNVYAQKDLEVMGNVYVDGNVVAYKDLLVSGNVSITEELTISNNVYAQKDLEVVGNVYVDGNVVAYKDLLVSGNVTVTEELTISNNVYADKDLEVVGNVYVDGNVVAYKDLLVSGNVYVSQNVSVTEELTISNNVYADKDLEVVGNVYVDGNVVAYKDFTLTGNAYVSGNVNITNQLTVSDNAYVTGNVQVTEALIVSGNTHLEGDNVFITHTMDFLDPTTAIVTNPTSSVGINIGQLKNVNVASAAVEQVIVYDGTTWNNQYIDQTLIRVKNANGGELSKGTVVCTTGHVGNDIFEVVAANASDPDRMPAIGVLYQTLAQNGQGVAVSFGRADGLNTGSLDVSTFVEGETLYVSNTVTGGLSNVKPYGPTDLIQNAGILVNKNAGVGFITGIGRANDIPNAQLITDYNDMNYIYVNDSVNDMKKIASQNLNIPLTTAVSSSSNSAANAVTLRGVSVTSGDGFHGDLVVAGNVTVDTNTLKVDAEANRVGILTASPGQPLDVRGAANVGTFTTTTGTVTDATHSTSKDTGVLVLTRGGLGVEANIHATNVFAASHIAVGTSATSNTFDVRGTANVGALVATSTHISDSTAVTSKTTGALQVTGGVGIQGDIHATHANLEDVEADSVNVTDTTAATNKTSGALKVAGGVGIQGDLYATNGVFTTNVYITDHTDLNNKYLAMIDTNGSLIQSPVYVAPSGKYVISAAEAEFLGNITLGGNTTLLTSTSLIVEDRIIGIGSNNSAEGLDSGIIIEHQDDGTFANVALIHHADEHRFSIGYTQNTLTDNHILNASHPDNVILRVDLIGNTIVQNSLSVSEMGTFGTKVGISTTAPVANIHVVGNAFVTSNITTSSNVLITGDAAATSKTTGALQVAGGVGISGDIHATHANLEDVEADSVTVTDTTTSTSITTGALKVAGGVSTQEKLNVGGITKVWDSTAVTSKTDGALVVVGGVGISGDIHATHANLEDVEADSVNVTNTTAATNKTSGALTVAGGVGVSGALYGAAATFDGVTSVTNATAATSKTDGALVVTGGVGVSGALYGAAATFDGVTSVTNATAVTSKTDGALVVTGGVGISGDIHATHANLEDVEADSVNVTNTTAATNKTSGALQVAGGVGVSGALFGAAATFDGVTSVTNATAVTSKTDGALVVTGGVGISGDIHATHANLEDVEADSVTVTDATQATDTLTGALTVAGGLSTQTNVHAANVYISGGLITNTAGVTKKTYAYSGTIGDTEQPHINVCFTNQSFNAKIDAQLIEGDDEISTISFVCCGGNKGGTFPASDIQVGSVQVFGPASTNPWSSAIVTDKTTVALKPSGAIDTSGEYHIFVEYTTAKSAGAVANVVQDTTEQIVFGY